jgi:hypothetical protein
VGSSERRGPELLGRHRWMGGVEGGAVEERTRHVGVDEGDGAKKGGRAAPFMVARWRSREKGAGGSGVEGGGGWAASCGHAARGGAGGGGGPAVARGAW